MRREGELTAVHGSPRDPTWEYISDAGVASANLDAFDTRLCLHGHTHVPIVFRAEDRTMEVVAAQPGEPVSVNAGRLLINPGSVGQPRDGNPAASYAILDTAAEAAEFRRVRYDIEGTQRLMRELDLPPRLVERLSYGR